MKKIKEGFYYHAIALLFLFLVAIFVEYGTFLGEHLLSQDVGNVFNRSDQERFFQSAEGINLPEDSMRIKEEGIDRFFLSKVVIIDNRYIPMVHACLFDKDQKPLFPLYIYDFWSSLDYPNQPPYKVILVRYRVFPEDNYFFQPDKECYIKEIETEEDWREMEEKYDFYRELFI